MTSPETQKPEICFGEERGNDQAGRIPYAAVSRAFEPKKRQRRNNNNPGINVIHLKLRQNFHTIDGTGVKKILIWMITNEVRYIRQNLAD